MRNILLGAASGLCLAALPLAPARAQTLPELQDLVVQGEQVNRTAEAATGQVAVPLGTSDGAVDGESGVYLLTVNKIFQLTANAGIGYTDNPTRTDADSGGSFFADFSAGAAVGTRFDEEIDLGASVSINGREFFKDYGPSNRSVAGTASAGLPVAGPLYLGVAGFGGYSFNGKFEQGVSFYGLSGTLSAPLVVASGVVIRPGIGAVRQWSGVSENNSSSLSASVDISYTLTPKLSLLARGLVSRRWYDDFYEDVTFVARRDTLYGISATALWRPVESFLVSASASYDKQDSRLFLAGYDALELALVLSARYRF